METTTRIPSAITNMALTTTMPQMDCVSFHRARCLLPNFRMLLPCRG
jgi:hypothetical protein